MKQDIQSILDQGYSLITPTSRLSRYLSNEYAQRQLSAGAQVWESPSIIPWSAWLLELQRTLKPELEFETYILNTHQQSTVWTRIIRESDFSSQLLQVSSVARQVMQAWELVHQWQLPIFPEDVFINEDAYAFQYWADRYLKECEEKQWTDEFRFPDLLVRHLADFDGCNDMKFAFVGFDEVYPQQSSLLEKLGASGADVLVPGGESELPDIKTFTFHDERTEIESVANWARHILSTDDSASIGIIVPGLAQSRDAVMQAFDDILLSENVLAHQDPENRPYSVALGQPLSSYPVIAAAFRVLELLTSEITLEDLGALLTSPWLKGADKERRARYVLDAQFRESGRKSFTFSQLLPVLELSSENLSGFEQILRCFRALDSESSEFAGRHPAHVWAEKIDKLLGIFGWPGERSLNSSEYQTVQAWQDLLLQFSSLDVVMARFDARTAVTQLYHLAANYSFQGESAETRLQVLSPGAAAGMHFEYVWMLGMHEEAWPAAMEANPFVPLALQKRHKLPFASAELRLARRQRLTNTLLGTGNNIVLSYPMFDEDRQLRPSATLRKYFSADAGFDLKHGKSYQAALYESSNLEYLSDDRGTSLAAGEIAKGGSALFKDQAACAFRAYSKHRLSGKTLSEADIGLSAAERGLLLHEVMQGIYEKITTHKALLELDKSTQLQLVDSSLKRVIEKYRRYWPHVFTPGFIEIEHARLQTLVVDWLELEKQRAPFRVIAREENRSISFAGVQVNTRMDRIDELADGRVVLIDYKTGTVSPSAWFGDRPDDPQLPLYAVSQNQDVAALVFGKLTSSETKFSGIASDDDLLPGVKHFKNNRNIQDQEWGELFNIWRDTLTKLGSAFRDGEAEVNPKNEMACRYCDLHGFCRISEISYRLNDEESH